MKFILKDIGGQILKGAGIMALIIVVLRLHFCTGHHIPDAGKKVIVRTEYRDTGSYRLVVQQAAPVTVIQTRTDTLRLTRTDTVHIIHDYFTQKVYRRQLVNDTNLTATLQDTVFRGGLLRGSLTYHINRPIRTYTITQQAPPTRKLYIGVYGSYSAMTRPGLGVTLLYTNRQDRGIQAGFDFLTGAPMVGLFSKISLHKP